MSAIAFNDLSDAETERLALLMEECSEVIQIVGKILRHGYASTHPDNENGPTNREMLEEELGHVLAAVQIMDSASDIVSSEIKGHKRKKIKKVNFYLHHNAL